jgi:hypothetical protein
MARSGRSSLLSNASRFLLLVIGIALLRMQRGKGDGAPSPPTGTDQQPSGTDDFEDPGLRRVDQAALMGAALAAILAVFLPAGRWEGWGSVVGITLTFVIAGFYRVPDSAMPSGWRDAITRAGALACVAALCVSIAIAWPLQSIFVSDKVCRSEQVNLEKDLERHPIRLKELTDNCVGREVGEILIWVWFGLAIAILGWHLSKWRPPRKGTSEGVADGPS